MTTRNEYINRSDLRRIVRRRTQSLSDVTKNPMGFLKDLVLFGVALGAAALFIFPFYWLIKVATMWPSRTIYEGDPSLVLDDPQLYNFVTIFYEIPIASHLMSSLTISLIAVAGVLIFNSLAAYALIQDFYGKRFVMVLLVAGLMIPYYVTLIPAYLVTQRLGLLDTHLGAALPFIGLIIGLLILKNSFESVPSSIIESARLDGASDFYIIFGVLWPLAKPALAVNVILAFIQSWNAFLWPLVVVTSRDTQPLTLGLSTFMGRFDGEYALAYAFAIIVLLPLVVMFLLMQKQFIQSVVRASVKE